ncbi:hypothetical protein B7P43_G11492 [Cryptotermes secundus]|uniref:Reverse transcriptase domain-containing protein n=1 Tax=Cryptotermes secundus TaxID=105785 RepID=A0A2J7RRL4_9NEOP|nr:hypothetical protein B7P43_G11492 [Cryptotermes secundus]
MLLSRHQNAGQYQAIKIGNRCFENVAQFRYSGTTITNQNLIQEEIKRRLNSGNAYYHSVQKLLSSCLLPKKIKIRIYKTTILPVVLYGCETRKLHNEELHNLYISPSISRMIKSRRMRWAGYVARMGERQNAHRILMGKPKREKPLGRPRRRWVDNIKMDLREIGWDGMDFIDLAQDRDRWRALLNTVIKLRVP